MSADTLVKEWSLDEPTFVTVDEQSMVEVTGSVTFDHAGTGRVRIAMQALGLQGGAGGIDESELTQD